MIGETISHDRILATLLDTSVGNRAKLQLFSQWSIAATLGGFRLTLLLTLTLYNMSDYVRLSATIREYRSAVSV